MADLPPEIEAAFESDDPQEVFDALMEPLCLALSADRCFLYLRDGSTKRGGTVASWSVSDEFRDMRRPFEPEIDDLFTVDPMMGIASTRTRGALHRRRGDRRTGDPQPRVRAGLRPPGTHPRAGLRRRRAPRDPRTVHLRGAASVDRGGPDAHRRGAGASRTGRRGRGLQRRTPLASLTLPSGNAALRSPPTRGAP